MCTALILRAAGASAQTDPASTPIKMDITLKEAIKIALSENPTIRVADKDIELKKTADKEAWQQLLPEANVSGSLTHTLLAAEMKLNGNTFKMGQDGTTTGNAAVSLSLPIFAPAVYKTMSMTKADIQLALEQSRASKLDLTNQVTKAFYQLLLAQDSYEVMKQSYAISEENFNVVNSKYVHGAVSEYDKISAEVQMRSMSSSLTSAQTALSLAQLQLKVLMGVTEDVTLNIKDRLENYEDELILADPETSKQELTNNSQLRQFDLNKTLLEKTRKVLQTSFIPTLSFSLNYQYQSLYNNSFNIFRYDSGLGSVQMGVFFGLLIGKPLGIMLFSWLSVKLRIGDMPAGSSWGMLAAVACLGGIGFTMSIFIDTLSFGDQGEAVMLALRDAGKIAVLLGSLCSGLLGSLFIFLAGRRK